MPLKIGPLEINFKWNKSWNQLNSIISREKGSTVESLKTNPKTQLQEYKSWVYNCVGLISDRVSTLPYGFYNKLTDEELKSSNKGFKVFTKPFIHPNDLMTFRFIKSFCQIQLDLCGMTCLYKAYNRLGQVWEIWPLNMNDFMKVEVSNDFMNPSVKYYFSMGAGKYIDFDINELIVINYPSPVNPYDGMSPIQSQAYAADIDTYIEVYERDFFKNSARIDFALTTDTQLNQEKADELKERWTSKYKGTFHEVAVLDSGLKPIPLKYTNRDFEFLNLAGWSKEKILGCYRVPMNKLGSVESNRAGSVYSDISFNREAIQPRTILWDEELTEGILMSYDERIEIRHQNPIPRDRQIELQEAKSYLGGMPSLTVNEVREKIHKLAPTKNGDRVILKTGNGYIFLDELDQIPLEDRIGSGSSENDRDRDGEKPHVNPDGTDDRDDNPTDGRALMIEEEKEYDEFFSLVNKCRPVWNQMIFDAVKDIKSENLHENLKVILFECLSATIDTIFDYYKIKNKDFVSAFDWVVDIANKTSIEYTNTLFKNPKWEQENWKTYFKDQFDSNPRLSKILNALLRSVINYSKWLILTNKQMEIEWKINSNECAHRGRLEKLTTIDNFKLGITKIRFPGETLSFNCDCTIKRYKGVNIK